MRARGFTLIEMVMVIVVLGIIAAVGAPLLAGSMQVFSVAAPEIDTLSKGRYAMERIARELRDVSHNGTAYNLTLAANSASFTRTDGTVVTLTAAPPVLSIDYNGGGAVTLVDQLPAGGASFGGFAVDGTTATTNAAQIAFVQVNLTLERNPGVAGTNTVAYQTRVLLRSRP